MKSLIFSLSLLLAVGLAGCDATGPVDTVTTAPTANAEYCDPELGCPDPPPQTCPIPPRPYHETVFPPGGGGPPGNYDVNAFLDRRGLNETSGNAYYLQYSFGASSTYFTWGQFTTTLPNNSDFYYRTIVNTDPSHIRTKRVCPNGAVSYSSSRDVTGADSFPQGWHDGNY